VGFGETIEPLEVQAIVLGPDGQPLNDVRVEWSLAFASINSLIFDTNGDGLGDAGALQLVDPNGCKEVADTCLDVSVSLWFGLGAFRNSPFTTLTDNFGISRVIILVNGNFGADPTVLSASTGTGSIDIVEFSVN